MLTIEAEDEAAFRRAQSDRGRRQRLKHGLQIKGRTTDRLEYAARRRFSLHRLREFLSEVSRGLRERLCRSPFPRRQLTLLHRHEPAKHPPAHTLSAGKAAQTYIVSFAPRRAGTIGPSISDAAVSRQDEFQERSVRIGSIASVLRCPPYVRFAGNFRNTGLLVIASS